MVNYLGFDEVSLPGHQGLSERQAILLDEVFEGQEMSPDTPHLPMPTTFLPVL